MNKIYMNRTPQQKVKEAANQIKEKTDYASSKVQEAASKTKNLIRKKPSSVDYYVSITIALLLIVSSYLSAVHWLFWLGAVSITCSMLQLIFSKKKARP